jgi:hypothetical protein
MTIPTQATDLSSDDYCVLGVATCFIREDGEVRQVKIVEPIPSAALEAIVKGIPTSYEVATAKTLGEIFVAETVQIPFEFPAEVHLCDRFSERVLATARTYKSRSAVQEHIPLGTLKNDFNYSTAQKRVLNADNVVRAEDNVKQHEYTHQVL